MSKKANTISVDGVAGQVARVREKANGLVEQELAARGIAGVMPAHGTVLAFLLDQDGPVPIKTVVAATGRVKSTVTGMVNTLVKHRYLRKKPSEQDGRVTFVELTDKGRTLREDFEAISRTLLQTLYGDMPEPDRQTLVKLLSQLERNLQTPEEAS